MKKYCESIYKTERWKTREVMVGNVGVGGNNPVRIQSMTTSNTRDVDATVDQAMRLADAGCEIVRITVQGIKEADACEHIKNTLVQKGYNTPLVADIHFFPPAAFRVIDFVDKVRINPGNFVDKRASFKQIDYDDDSYAKEIERIEEKFTPLVQKCKTLNKAMRIGTNHGSLSDRIMNRYGDTPRGMLESALEFARICVKNDFHNFVFSMKSSNPQVMIQAYRLLVAEMMSLNWNYPLHLGVTEAGEGEDGRIKSAMGIGTLLLDGLGDTIRVSLTEDPWYEIDPCKRLIQVAQSYQGQGITPFEETFRNIDEIKRRHVSLPKNLALHRDGTVIISATQSDLEKNDFYRQIGSDGALNLPKLKVSSPDGLVITDLHGRNSQTKKLTELKNIGISLYGKSENDGLVPYLALDEALARKATLSQMNRFTVTPQPAPPFIVVIYDETEEKWELLKNLRPSVIFFSPTIDRLHKGRHFFEWLQKNGIDTPVILNFKYDCSKEDLVIKG
jgi:(E)-4-hydroxy-3-methylbut-2-enyl-diphosphate synthase